MLIKYCISAVLVLAGLVAEAQKKTALVVGISDYPESSGFSPIHGDNDAKVINYSLEKQGFTITQILNSDATALHIRNALETVANNSQSGDYVYLHFSCHGQPVEDKEPFDEDDHWDEALVAYDAKINYQSGVYEGENHILDDELYGYFNRIRDNVGSQGFLCVVIDACHSGNSSRDDDDDEKTVRGVSDGFSSSGKSFAPVINRSGSFKIESRQNAGDILIFEACRSYQNNYEIQVDGNHFGPLSYYVAKTLDNYQISKKLDWIFRIKSLMDGDRQILNQNMVYEKSF